MKVFSLSILFLVASMGSATAAIDQARGIDQRVNYLSLTKYGPWDDRNYNLTKEDVALFPNKDQYLANVPAFFKIEVRKEQPNLGEFYPRSTYQYFQIRHGGLLVDGKWLKTGRGKVYHPGDDPYGKPVTPEQRGALVDPDVEIPLDLGVAGNEVSVEFNPTNPMIGVAGSNRSQGQTMYYTTDGGLTWTRSQINPSSCCDPTVDWSSDGSIVYQADLSSSIGVRWAVSTDQGVTWGPMQVLTPSGSDKEFIHVDRSASSPFQDNVYLTYHNGNVMQFARSVDMGASFMTPLAFGGEPTGIGSDITTDAAGNIYYFYPALGGQGIRLLKSTDGGATFAPGTQVAPLNGRFDFPIPSMETREAFIYVSADVDPLTGDIYAAWTDETDDSFGGGNGTAANNHGWIEVYKSTDQGASWTRLPHPHDATDTIAGGSPIDRYHPWIKVAENGVVHIGYYDTRNSANRTGIDFYYTWSTDGGATWETEQRFSTVTSPNLGDGQEWGDYNGLSVVLDRLAMTWTDNRPANGKAAVAGAVVNPTGLPSFTMAANPNSFEVCNGDTGIMSTIDVGSILSFNNDTTLSVSSLPPVASNVVFGTNPVTPPGNSNLTFDVAGGTSGNYTLTIEGNAASTRGPTAIIRSVDLSLAYSLAAPGVVVQTAPADMATLVPLRPMFQWAADAEAVRYTIEVATDVSMTNIVYSASVAAPNTSHTPTTDLPSNDELFWRVTAGNGCNDTPSAVISFTTVPLPGDCPADAESVTVTSFDFESGAQGWTHGFNQGIDTWTLSTANPGPGSTQHWHVDDQDTTSDTFLTSPAIVLPSNVSPLSFHFQNSQHFESNGANCWDGGILEIAVGAGAFAQVSNNLLGTDPYDGQLSGGPLAGSEAWCGDPQAYLNSIVDIDAQAGQTVQFRFRVSTDVAVGRPGWDIDDVSVKGCFIDPDILFRNSFE